MLKGEGLLANSKWMCVSICTNEWHWPLCGLDSYKKKYPFTVFTQKVCRLLNKDRHYQI